MKPTGLDEGKETGLRRLGCVLHDLCQPLTAMQCRLEMAQMIDTDQDYREAVALALQECDRLSNCVAEMRGLLRAMAPGSEDAAVEAARQRTA